MRIYHDIETLFESWKKRQLTLFVKVTLVNSLALPKLLYADVKHTQSSDSSTDFICTLR